MFLFVLKPHKETSGENSCSFDRLISLINPNHHFFVFVFLFREMLLLLWLLLLLGVTEGILPEGIRVDRDTSTFRDQYNRTLLYHGYNYVEKSAPFYPTITNEDITIMKDLGIKVIRLGVMIDGLFPTSPEPDINYMKNIKNIISQLWENGIATIVDLHQDVLARKICGEGAPDWMINTEELNSLPFPEPLYFHNTSRANNSMEGGWNPPISCNPVGKGASLGWSEFYGTDASGKAWQQLLMGEGTLGKMFSVHWATVANSLKNSVGVLAYEMLNEPWVGDVLSDPLLLAHGVAEKKTVGVYMERINNVIRQIDNNTMTFYSAAEVNNRLMRHVGYEYGFLPQEPLAWHVYCLTGTDGSGPTSLFTKVLCHLNDEAQVEVRNSDLHRLKTAGFVTEFGAVDDSPSGLREINYVADKLDTIKVSWCFWSDYGSLSAQSSLYNSYLARSYPLAVAGELISFHFDHKTSIFEMEYVPSLSQEEGATKQKTTEIFLSQKYHYQNGFDTLILPKNCCNTIIMNNGIQITHDNSPPLKIGVQISPK